MEAKKQAAQLSVREHLRQAQGHRPHPDEAGDGPTTKGIKVMAAAQVHRLAATTRSADGRR
jgi:hypothetical protein